MDRFAAAAQQIQQGAGYGANGTGTQAPPRPGQAPAPTQPPPPPAPSPFAQPASSNPGTAPPWLTGNSSLPPRAPEYRVSQPEPVATPIDGERTGGMTPMPRLPEYTAGDRTGGMTPFATKPMPSAQAATATGLSLTPGPTGAAPQATMEANPGVQVHEQGTWEGGPNVTLTRSGAQGLPTLANGLDRSGMPQLAAGMDTRGFADFDQDFAGASERAAKDAYSGATQFFDEDFGADTSALKNQLINQGLQPGSEAYNREMSLLQRGQNQARTQAGFMAGQVGHQRAGDLMMRALEARRLQGAEAGQDASIRLASRGQLAGEAGQDAATRLASRGSLMGERERDADRLHAQSMGLAGLRLGSRGQDMGVQQAAHAASGQSAAAGAAAASARERMQMESDLALRRLGLDQDNMDFSQFMQLVGGARGGVNAPNFGSPSPLDVGGAYGIASGNNNAALNRGASDRAAIAGLGAAALGSYFSRP